MTQQEKTMVMALILQHLIKAYENKLREAGIKANKRVETLNKKNEILNEHLLTINQLGKHPIRDGRWEHINPIVQEMVKEGLIKKYVGMVKKHRKAEKRYDGYEISEKGLVAYRAYLTIYERFFSSLKENQPS